MLKRFMVSSIGYEPPNAAAKGLILSILNSTATKREARDYIAKYADGARINYCLLLTRHLNNINGKSLWQLSEAIERLRMLGLRPICLIPPSRHVNKQAEALDKVLTYAQLMPLHLQNGLTKLSSGQYESILSQPDLFNNEQLQTVVPIIKPYVFDESSAKEYETKCMVKFTNYLCEGKIPYIDKFFILNQFGGIPSGERHEKSHVFINLSQEFDSLSKSILKKYDDLCHAKPESEDLLGRLKLYAKEGEISSMQGRLKEHLEDLQLMNVVLPKLSSASTGLITTIKAASLNSDRNNPLLYNLLTDRSLISSSLPRFKKRHISLECSSESHSWYELPYDIDEHYNTKKVTDDPVSVTTVLKKGVHIKLFRDMTLTQHNSTGLPENYQTPKTEDIIHSKKERVNLDKLKYILDQSFGRELDLKHYLERINGKIAAIIVIGNYEGIAILTFEGPPTNPFVYLDKFAVLPHLKGSLGISDIIFNLMFKIFPKELLWRSRRDNVVNKWYFQRSVGVVDLSIELGNGDRKESQFKLFYHGDPEAAQKSFHNYERLKEYAKYVRDIRPSWKK